MYRSPYLSLRDLTEITIILSPKGLVRVLLQFYLKYIVVQYKITLFKNDHVLNVFYASQKDARHIDRPVE